MFTGISIVALFILVCGLSFLEKYMGKYKLIVYLAIGLILILLAGLREVGIDPDSENYEEAYHHYYSNSIFEGVEYSFILISTILNYFSSDVHLLFLFYAFLGVGLKFISFRKYSELWFLPVLVYIGYYYELHEMTQIRTGILSGIFLLSIKYLAEEKRIHYVLLILIGAFFHISAIALLPFVFLTNKPLSPKMRLFWLLIIPAAYMFYFTSSVILINLDIPYIGTKIASYQDETEKGISAVQINVLSPRHLFTLLTFIYLLYFHDTILMYNKYFPILIKIFSISLVAFVALSFLPVLAQRVSYLYQIVSIVLITNVYYTIKPKWAGILLVTAIAFVHLNYALPFVSFNLFWKGG